MANGEPRLLPHPLSHPLSSPLKLSFRFVYIQSFLSLSLSLRSKSQRFVPCNTNCPPPIKNRLCRLLRMHHFNKPTKPICHEMHPGVRTEFQKGALLYWVLTTISCHRSQNGGPGSKLRLKKSTSIFCTYIFNIYFQNLKNKSILKLGLDPLLLGRN